jgi:hypothetical protein
MIKFFNKIRKQMLDQKKTGRYLKYAIGEIVLVMIGILLALQVNTWNNNRELKKEEQKILKSLHGEFNENLEKFDIAYKVHLKRKKVIHYSMLADLKPLSADSLSSILNIVNGNWTFDPFQGIYNSVINSGKIELISNDNLKSKIARLQDLIRDYQEEEKGTQQHSIQNLYPYEISQPLGSFRFFIGDAGDENEALKVKKNLLKFFESQQYNNIMIPLNGWMKDIFTEGPVLREEMVSIIKLLESEIEKYEN